MDTKVTTVIVNTTKQGLTMKVGNRHCYAKLTSIKQGTEYRLQLDVNWTYQEFVLQDKSRAGNQLFLSSDDCCDYKRITVTEQSDGRLAVLMQLRQQFRTDPQPCSLAILEEDKEAAEEKPVRLTVIMQMSKCCVEILQAYTNLSANFASRDL